nr:insulin-like peptide 6 [Hyphantria cunea]
MLAALCWETEMVKRDDGWWMSQERAQALGSVRGQRGPAEECCDKPCTVEELLTYSICEEFFNSTRLITAFFGGSALATNATKSLSPFLWHPPNTITFHHLSFPTQSR